MNKHRNISVGGTPMWMYVALAYFAYDDILRMMMSPILFYPIIFILSIIMFIYSSGMGDYIGPMVVPVAR